MSKAAILDIAEVRERVAEDLELFFEIFDCFFETYSSSVEEIKLAVAEKDAERLGEAAHSIKSAIGNLGGMRAYECAYELEKLGRSATLETAGQTSNRLFEEIEAFRGQALELRARGTW